MEVPTSYQVEIKGEGIGSTVSKYFNIHPKIMIFYDTIIYYKSEFCHLKTSLNNTPPKSLKHFLVRIHCTGKWTVLQ